MNYYRGCGGKEAANACCWIPIRACRLTCAASFLGLSLLSLNSRCRGLHFNATDSLLPQDPRSYMGRMYKNLRDFQGDDWAGSPAARDPELAPWVPYLMQMFRPEEGAYLMPYDQPRELDEGWTSKEGQSWETKVFGDARAASDGDAVARGDARQQAVEGISKDVLHPFPEAAALLETPPDQLTKEEKRSWESSATCLITSST